MNPRIATLPLVLLTLLLLTLPGPAARADEPFAEVVLEPDGLLLKPLVPAAGFQLTVRSRYGITVEKSFGPNDTPEFRLADLGGVRNLDGQYAYQLTLEQSFTKEEEALLEALAASDDPNALPRAWTDGLLPLPVRPQAGFFVVEEGEVLRETETESTGELQTAAPISAGGGLQPHLAANQVFTDELCVGFSCFPGEHFGGDAIHVVDPSPDVLFRDTSLPPKHSWRFLINGSNLSAASSFFTLEDVDTLSNVFTVQADAAPHSLVVASGGGVGVGTNVPSANLEVEAPLNPTLHLRQSGSGTIPGRTWKMKGTQDFFGISSGGNIAQFAIFKDAKPNTLVLGAAGMSVGQGLPSATLHVIRSDGTAQIFIDERAGVAQTRELLRLKNNGGARINLNDIWHITAIGGNLTFDDPDTPGLEVRFLDNGGGIEVNGQGLSVPDYVFDPGYPLMPLEALEAFVTEQRHLPGIPSAADTQQRGLNLVDLQLKLLEKIEELTLYTLEQERENAALRTRITALENR